MDCKKCDALSLSMLWFQHPMVTVLGVASPIAFPMSMGNRMFESC